MTRSRFRTVAMAGSVATCAIVLAAPGSAFADKRVESKGTIDKKKSGPNGAGGKVTADKGACEPKRTVKLFRDSGSYRGSGGASAAGMTDQLIGRDKTNKNGVWFVDEALFAGVYYAVVTRSELARFFCLRDRSPRVSL